MSEKKPYLDFTFTGVHSFTEALDKTLISYRIFEDENISRLYDLEPEILDREKDTITMGSCTRDGKTLFFVEFGLQITESFKSYLLFMCEKRPGMEELQQIASEIEEITVNHLKEVHDKDVDEIEKFEDMVH